MNEALKAITKHVIDVIEEVDRSLANGWQFKDTWNFLDEIFATPKVIKQVPEAWSVLKAGLTEEQRLEWVGYVETELDIPHEEAEIKVESLFVWLMATGKMLNAFKKKDAV